jgi:hypothetical protein
MPTRPTGVFQNQVGAHRQSRIAARTDVGAQHGEARPVQLGGEADLGQVELAVADGHRMVANGGHPLQNGFARGVERQVACADRIACIQQQHRRVRPLRLYHLHQLCGTLFVASQHIVHVIGMQDDQPTHDALPASFRDCRYASTAFSQSPRAFSNHSHTSRTAPLPPVAFVT